MATVNVAGSDDFSFYEAVVDLNGDSTNKDGSDTFRLSESFNVHPVGDFPFYPPFFVTMRPMIYSASFGGDEGYEEPTTVMRLVAGSEYPQINATLYAPDDQELEIDWDGDVLAVSFNLACADGTYLSLPCSEVTGTGRLRFTWPDDAPIGTHLGRFTLFGSGSPATIWSSSFTQANGPLTTLGSITAATVDDLTDAGWWGFSPTAIPVVASNAISADSTLRLAVRGFTRATDSSYLLTGTLTVTGSAAILTMGFVLDDGTLIPLTFTATSAGNGNLEIASLAMGGFASGTFSIRLNPDNSLHVFQGSTEIGAVDLSVQLTGRTVAGVELSAIAASGTGTIDTVSIAEEESLPLISVPTHPLTVEVREL